MPNEATFQWTCPVCDSDQTTTITKKGPFGVLKCQACDEWYTGLELPREIDRAWIAAIEEVSDV